MAKHHRNMKSSSHWLKVRGQLFKAQELIIWAIIQIKLVSVQKLDCNKVCNKYPMEILEELKVKISVD